MTKLPTIDRRSWLAAWLQKRRRARAPKAPTPSFTISLDGTTVNIVQVGPDAYFAIGIQYSADGETGWEVVGDLQFGATSVNTDGWDTGFYRICWEDENGQGQAPFSNVVQIVPPGVAIELVGTVLNIAVTGTFPGTFMAVFWNDEDNSPRDEIDDIPTTQTTYDLTGQAAGWFYIGKINPDGSAGTPISNGVYYNPAPDPAITLTSDGHGHLSWTLNFSTSYDSINIYKSADGATWDTAPYDGWDLASGNRDCSGDPGYFRICVCDWDGNDVLPYSNAVYSDGL